MSVICPYCSRPAQLVASSDIYPNRTDLPPQKFYRCYPCDAYVGCHQPGTWRWDSGCKVLNEGTEPLGRLADAELRAAKKAAHEAFGPVWHGKLHRHDAYIWLAIMLGIKQQDCHIGLFDLDQCAAVVRAVRALETMRDHKGQP